MGVLLFILTVPSGFAGDLAGRWQPNSDMGMVAAKRQLEMTPVRNGASEEHVDAVCQSLPKKPPG
jgi:hypothetical protein